MPERDIDKGLVEIMTQISNISTKQKNYQYTCFEDYYLKTGRLWSHLPMPDHRKVELRLEIEKIRFSPEIKNCFYNAQTFLLSRSSWNTKPNPFQYVEGYAVSSNVPSPIHHGWLDFHGFPIDFTLRTKREDIKATRDIDRLMKRILSNIKNNAYLGRIFPETDIRNIWIAEEQSRPVVDDWKNGFPLLRVVS